MNEPKMTMSKRINGQTSGITFSIDNITKKEVESIQKYIEGKFNNLLCAFEIEQKRNSGENELGI